MGAILLSTRLFFLVALQSCVRLVTAANCGNTILRQDFNAYPGEYKFMTAARADELFPPGPARKSGDGALRESGMMKGGSHGLERLLVGHNVAKVNHHAGCVGAKTTASDGRPCGVLLQVRLAKAMQAATLTYKVKFSRDFDWTLGGKLPGLCSESVILTSTVIKDVLLSCPVGCTTVSHNAGWSNRIMWRKKGHLVSYAYHPHKEKRCGQDFRWGKQAVPGEWHEIKLYMKMNVPGVANGIQKVWFDGDLAWEKYDLLYRNRPGHKIEKFIFNNFHGGNANGPNAALFAPEHDQAVWIDDIVVQEGECPGPISVNSTSTYIEDDIGVNTVLQNQLSAMAGSIVSDTGRYPILNTGFNNEFRLRGM